MDMFGDVHCTDTDPDGEVVTAAIRHGAWICMACGRDDHDQATDTPLERTAR